MISVSRSVASWPSSIGPSPNRSELDADDAAGAAAAEGVLAELLSTASAAVTIEAPLVGGISLVVLGASTEGAALATGATAAGVVWRLGVIGVGCSTRGRLAAGAGDCTLLLDAERLLPVAGRDELDCCVEASLPPSSNTENKSSGSMARACVSSERSDRVIERDDRRREEQEERP